MKKSLLVLLLSSCAVFTVTAQNSIFKDTLKMPAGFIIDSILLPPSPLTTQILFIGGHDIVQTTRTYGNPAGVQIAKEWHDFIGFTPDTTRQSLGWISVNHEMIYRDDKIGDGGGMTVFRVRRNANDQLEVIDQTLTDGRKGKFFNVDFVNTVGETGMNCAGISSTVDGRIWTAEEWFRTNNASINNGAISTVGNARGIEDTPIRIATQGAANQGVRDTADFTIRNSGFADFDGRTIRKFQNFNWMVEIDPRQAKAIRKQYNWGRQGFEGGAIAADNRTVYLGEDATPGWFTKFVADTPGDFTKGKIYAYKHDIPEKWVEIPNNSLDTMMNFSAAARRRGATGYARAEWVAIDPKTNKVYWTETGVDDLGPEFARGLATGATIDPGHVARAQSKGFTSATDANYKDYYGRIWVYDPKTLEHYIYLEGGPDLPEPGPAEANYPSKHLSNPDGLNVMQIDGKSFLVINEDLNNTTFGRVPAGVNNLSCEVYLLDLSKTNPTVNDLIRLTTVPRGAEVTGACPTPDGKSLLLNSQHSSVRNAFPYNHSFTFAIHGFDKLKTTALQDPEIEKSNELKLYPNPTRRVVFMNKTVDAAIYDLSGKRIRVVRNTNELDVADLAAGTYFVQTADGEVKKLVIQ